MPSDRDSWWHTIAASMVFVGDADYEDKASFDVLVENGGFCQRFWCCKEG